MPRKRIVREMALARMKEFRKQCEGTDELPPYTTEDEEFRRGTYLLLEEWEMARGN